MNEPRNLPDQFWDLVDEYCSGLIDEEGLRRLEEYLLASAESRREFASYCQLQVELPSVLRARRASDDVPAQVLTNGRWAINPVGHAAIWSLVPPDVFRGRPLWLTLAAGVLLTVIGYVAHHGRHRESPMSQGGKLPAASVPAIAWLVNAQDCLWAGEQGAMPGRDMRTGKVLHLERGLAEIEFDRGARVILQGPARLELLSANVARLWAGTLTAHVPHSARGFTVLSPRGKIVDMGTEFGLAVDDRGNTAIHVFKGEVKAIPLATGNREPAGVTLLEDQEARIDGRDISLQSPDAQGGIGRFVRAIVPPPLILPRTRSLTFHREVPGSLQDGDGRGIGLTHRLPGTGGALPERDANLRLDPADRALRLTTTQSDINQQIGMVTGEYLGLRLSDLGFTGREDFAIAATIAAIPDLEEVGQFGLYAGVRSDRNIRGGLISLLQPNSYGLFLVNNDGGRDSDLHRVGLMRTGEDLRLILRRIGGRYSLLVENLSTKSSSTLAIASPTFLDGEADLYVGLFGANTRSDVRKTLTIRELNVTVWTIASASGPPAGEAAEAGSDVLNLLRGEPPQS